MQKKHKKNSKVGRKNEKLSKIRALIKRFENIIRDISPFIMSNEGDLMQDIYVISSSAYFSAHTAHFRKFFHN